MIIEKHNHKDRVILDLEINEFLLIAHLINQSKQRTLKSNIVKQPIDVEIDKKIQEFIKEEFTI